MGRVRQARVCPLLDTYAWFEVSTLKVFGGDYEPRDLSSQAELPIPLARHERRADRASAAFCAVQKTGSNEILEKRCAAPRPITPCGPLGLPLLLLPPLQDFTDKDTNGTNNLLFITHGELTVRLRPIYSRAGKRGLRWAASNVVEDVTLRWTEG